MKFRIFQSYYEPQQKTLLDSEFTPLDNTDNLYPELREYPVLMKCHKAAKDEGLDAWGYFSWRWNKKIPSLTGKSVINLIQDNPGYDVYIFNTQSEASVACINMWEHGQYFHPNLMVIMNEIYPKMKIDPARLLQLEHPETMFFSQYCIASCKFWDDYFVFLHQYISCLPLLDPQIKKLHDSSAEYFRDTTLGYFPFIIERLLSNFVSMNQNKYKIFSYQHHNIPRDFVYDKLYFLKTSALKYQDVRILNEWLEFRKSIDWWITIGQNWPIRLR